MRTVQATLRSAAAGLVSAATLSGPPTEAAGFQLNSCDAGVLPGTIGNPITWTPASGSFTDSRGPTGIFAPTADGAANTPGGAYDNYFGMDANGPTVPGDGNPNTVGDGYSSNATLLTIDPVTYPPVVTGVGFRAGIVQGPWFSTTFVNSRAHAEFAGLDAMFILNLTLRPGSSGPTTVGLVVNIRDGADVNNPASAGGLGAVKFGANNASNNGGLWHQSYYLGWVATQVSGLNATFDGGTNYTIYLVGVPGPGPGGCLAIVFGAALRRRRRAL